MRDSVRDLNLKLEGYEMDPLLVRTKDCSATTLLKSAA
jgi:hypothetical protein